VITVIKRSTNILRATRIGTVVLVILIWTASFLHLEMINQEITGTNTITKM